MDPTIRLTQLLGGSNELMWDQAKKGLERMQQNLDDHDLLRPSDLAQLRSLSIPPQHSYQVLKVWSANHPSCLVAVDTAQPG